MPKSSILVSSDHRTFTQFSPESFRCSLANFRWACTCAFLSRETLRALQDFSPSRRSVTNCFLVEYGLSYLENEWMNGWCIYIALYYVLLYIQSASQSYGGGGGGGLSSTTTSVQHPLGWWDGCPRTTVPVRSPHTSYRWREERVIEPIKWMGIIRRPWLTRTRGGNLARTPGLHPYLEVPWDF